MTVRLRMALHGARNSHIFHLVAINQRAARDSKPIELLGIYDPRLRVGEPHKTVQWSVDRIKYWLDNGAQPSRTFVKLLEMVRICYVLTVPQPGLNGVQGNILPANSKYHPQALPQVHKKTVVPERGGAMPSPTPERGA